MPTKKAVTPKAPGAAKPEPQPVSEARYIRNLYQMSVRVRAGKKKDEQHDYKLSPRGQRGDFALVLDEDIKPLSIQDNDGLYEWLTDEQVAEITYKQTTNQQSYHPAQAALKDEMGRPIQGITTTVEGGDIGTVAHVTVPESDGSTSSRTIRIDR